MADVFKRPVEWFLARRGDREEQFKRAEQTAMSKIKFPPEFEIPVNMQTVNLEAIKPWISRKVTGFLGTEDDVVVNMVIAELERVDEPDPRRIQISMEGFLDKNAASFTSELWKLLLSAQENYLPGQKGIPTELIQEKLEEYAKIEQARIRAQKFIQEFQVPRFTPVTPPGTPPSSSPPRKEDKKQSGDGKVREKGEGQDRGRATEGRSKGNERERERSRGRDRDRDRDRNNSKEKESGRESRSHRHLDQKLRDPESSANADADEDGHGQRPAKLDTTIGEVTQDVKGEEESDPSNRHSAKRIRSRSRSRRGGDRKLRSRGRRSHSRSRRSRSRSRSRRSRSRRSRSRSRSRGNRSRHSRRSRSRSSGRKRR